MLLNKTPDDTVIRPIYLNYDDFKIKISREPLQWYRNDFILCVKKAFPN